VRLGKELTGMTLQSVETARSRQNPIDILEEIVSSNEWLHDRASEEELACEVEGRWCDYRMFFVWREETGALHFSCCFDARVPDAKRHDIHDLLAMINEKLWLGHFEVSSEDSVPMFRHTTLLRGAPGASVEQLEDLVDIALTECERFFPAFQFVIWGGKSASEAIGAAMFETVGEA
jgi:hypothetical protein